MDTVTKPFMTGRSQAIRIPKEYRFKMGEELYVNKVGDALVITPKDSLEKTFRKGLSMFTSDFMSEGRPEETSNTVRDKEISL